MPWTSFSRWCWVVAASHMFHTPVTVLTANRPVMAVPTAMWAPRAAAVRG